MAEMELEERAGAGAIPEPSGVRAKCIIEILRYLHYIFSAVFLLLSLKRIYDSTSGLQLVFNTHSHPNAGNMFMQEFNKTDEKPTAKATEDRGLKLQQCPAGAFKLWQYGREVYCLLFEDSKTMATLFGVGIPCGLVVLRRDGQCVRIFATQLSDSRWLDLWQSESTGCQISAAKLISTWESSACSTSTPTSSTASSSARSSSSSRNSTEFAGLASSPLIPSAEPDIEESLTFLTLDDEAGISTLHISVIMGNKPGEGIAADSGLVLAMRDDYLCTLGANIDFVFSELPSSLPKSIKRKMEVTIAGYYGLPGICIVDPVPAHVIPHGRSDCWSKSIRSAVTDMQHIGIIHDNMYINFECKESPVGSILLANEALDVTTMDLSHKVGEGGQTGWEGGFTVGSTSIAKSEVKRTRASSSVKEVTTLRCLHVLPGTQFRVRDMCHNSAIAQSLSYKATHIPPIAGTSKLEMVGLTTSPRDYVTSEVAASVRLKCKGEFLVIGSGLKKHCFEMGRSMGEFEVKEDKTFLCCFRHSRPTLIQAKQAFQEEFIINHDFDLRMYKNGHLYWVLMAVLERSPAPQVIDVVQ